MNGGRCKPSLSGHRHPSPAPEVRPPPRCCRFCWGRAFPPMPKACPVISTRWRVSFLISLLRLVDNELRDTELIGALRSCMAGLTRGRALPHTGRPTRICPLPAPPAPMRREEDALGEKLRAFFATLDGWRLRAQTLPLGELVRLVCDESGFYAYAGALPGGAQRQGQPGRAGDARRTLRRLHLRFAHALFGRRRAHARPRRR